MTQYEQYAYANLCVRKLKQKHTVRLPTATQCVCGVDCLQTTNLFIKGTFARPHGTRKHDDCLRNGVYSYYVQCEQTYVLPRRLYRLASEQALAGRCYALRP